jgi:hypothetical protein
MWAGRYFWLPDKKKERIIIIVIKKIKKKDMGRFYRAGV